MKFIINLIKFNLKKEIALNHFKTNGKRIFNLSLIIIFQIRKQTFDYFIYINEVCFHDIVGKMTICFKH